MLIDCDLCSGKGKRNRTRSVLNETVGAGTCMASVQETQKCNDHLCDCVDRECKPPEYSSYPKCVYQAQHSKNKTLVETPGQIEWCKQMMRAKNQYEAARGRFERGPPTIPCDDTCIAHKERATKLEQGKGTDELLHKQDDYQRKMRERRMEIKAKRVTTLRVIRKNHTDSANAIEVELGLLAGRQTSVTSQLQNLTQYGDQIPADLLLENMTLHSQNSNLTSVLNETLAKNQAVELEIQALTNSTVEYPSSKLPVLASPSMRRVPLDVTTFRSSGFNMSWLTPGWHHLAAVADGSVTKFYIDSQMVGTVQAVSKADVYSVGNYQGGGFQWGAIDKLQVYKKALADSDLQQDMGCFTPLLASAQAVTASSTGAACKLPGLNFWSRANAGWCADLAAIGSTWVQMSFATEHMVVAVLTVGDSNAAPVAGFVTDYELRYSSDGGNFTRYGDTVLKGNINQHEPKMFRLKQPVMGTHFRLGLVKWKGEATMRWELYGCSAGAADSESSSRLTEVVIKSIVGSRSVIASCGAGYAITGGGCSALNPPRIVLWSAPEGVSKWKCAGRGFMKAMAICTLKTSTIGNVVQQGSGRNSEFWKSFRTKSGQEYHKMADSDGSSVATCPQGTVMFGGGCSVIGSDAFAMQYTFPVDEKSWICGGNITYKPGMASTGSIMTKAFALCSAKEAFRSVQLARNASSDDWVSVTCPNNLTLISGGCHAIGDEQGFLKIFQYNGPDGRNRWTCGGHGFEKKVYAMCVNASFSPRNQSTQIAGTRGKTAHNSIIKAACECPEKCECPTRGSIGYVTNPAVANTTGVNLTCGSYRFAVHTALTTHPRKIPGCICPPRAPANMELEFKMEMPSDLAKFEHELHESIVSAAISPGQTCGCGNTTSCACRISVDKITRKQGTGSMWQWRGKHDRWHKLRDDKVFVHFHVAATPEADISESWYHTNMSASSVADRIVDAITDHTSKLRRSWFFMHISSASIVNRMLKRCDIQMNTWSYRDALPDNKRLNNGPSMWSKLNTGFRQCGRGHQSPIALGDMPQVSQSYWKMNNTDRNDVVFSNSRNDKLQFDYGENGTFATLELLNDALFLGAKFTGNLSFTEYGRNKAENSYRGKVSGGEFKLKRAVFHLPAEHTMHGVRHPMEIQYEHENEKGELAIVSTLLKFGFQNNFLAKAFADGIPMKCTAGLQQSNIKAAELFPFESDYYAYSGSDSKPPCRPASVYVFKQPATVSLAQWIDVAQRLGTERQYEEQCNRHGCKKAPIINDNNFLFSTTLKGNARPLQSLGGRVIRASMIHTNDDELDLH